MGLISALGLATSACSPAQSPPEHYVSGQTPLKLTGERINLKEVEWAFRNTRSRDFREWMNRFEQQVNAIYGGQETVSLEATHDGPAVRVTGFIERSHKPGFQAGDEQLFRMEQTGNLQDSVKELRGRVEDVQMQIQKQFQLLLEQSRQNQKQFQMALDQAQKNQKQFQESIDHIAHATKSLTAAMDNVVVLTARANHIAARAGEMADTMAPEMKVVIRNVEGLTHSVDGTIRSVDGLIRSVNGTVGGVNGLVNNPETQRHIAETTRNVASLTQRINALIEDLHQVTGDPSVRNDIKGLIREAHHTMQNASSLTGTLKGVVKGGGGTGLSMDLAGEMLGSAGDPLVPHVQANLLGQFNFGGSGFFRLGMQEIGGRNLLDLQYGLRPIPALDLRFGIVRGSLGIGSDLYLTAGTGLGIDLFDARTANLRAVLRQRFYGNWGIAGFYQNTLTSGANEYGLGISWRLR